jgi:hypothetical protein
MTKDNVEKIAVEEYKKCGQGIAFEDIKSELSVNKTKAKAN